MKQEQKGEGRGRNSGKLLVVLLVAMALVAVLLPGVASAAETTLNPTDDSFVRAGCSRHKLWW